LAPPAPAASPSPSIPGGCCCCPHVSSGLLGACRVLGVGAQYGSCPARCALWGHAQHHGVAVLVVVLSCTCSTRGGVHRVHKQQVQPKQGAKARSQGRDGNSAGKRPPNLLMQRSALENVCTAPAPGAASAATLLESLCPWWLRGLRPAWDVAAVAVPWLLPDRAWWEYLPGSACKKRRGKTARAGVGSEWPAWTGVNLAGSKHLLGYRTLAQATPRLRGYKACII
jgi:hypothetical protein